jgi:predicted ATPase/transcriptional regulator with XRE-family HTH domain
LDGHASFGYWVRRRRKALDLTQAELARRVGCASGTIKNIEADARRPSKQLAERLADHLAIVAAERAVFIQAARAQQGADRLPPPMHRADRAPDPATLLPGQDVQPFADLHQPARIVQSLAPGLPNDAPSPRTPADHRHNLPAQATTLIGREGQTQRICALLHRPGVRLVSLTGPGGVGKTRLALHVTAQVLDTYTDGCCVVELAPIREPGLVVTTIAQALGLRETGNQPLATSLTIALRERHMLLLLDNFEHVAAAAPAVAELLAAVPSLTILITSRASLHISGEHEVVVPPLALPDHRQHAPLDQYEAVQLFVARAEASDANFTLTDANGPAVAEICRRLDGLPLAIELAAARIKLFDAPALLDRLSPRLHLLTRGARDLPVRQQTLHNTLSWSYQLLDAGEQKLFRRLAVFVGGCTLAAAAVVLGSEFHISRWPTPNTGSSTPTIELDVLDGLSALVDQSLLRQTKQPNGEPRFTMLETTREYALEQLERAGEGEALRHQHAMYYLQLAETAERRLQAADQSDWLRQLEAEHDNLRAALAWSQAIGIPAARSGEAAEAGLRLAAALWWFWFVRGYPTEGRAWLAGALARTGLVATAVRAKALNGAGWLASLQGDFAAMRPPCRESLTISRELGDRRHAAYALLGLAWCAHIQNDHQYARELFEESLIMAREAADTPVLVFALHQLGRFAARHGEYERACALFDESLTRAREQHDSWTVASNLFQLGKVARVQGDYRQAQALLDESLALFRALGDPIDSAWSLNHLGNVARSQGDDARAAAYYDMSLTIFREQGNPNFIASVYQNLGYLALDQGDITRAAAILAESLAMSRAANEQRLIAWSLAGLGGVAAEQGRLERATRLLGAAEALFDAIDHAIDPIVGAAYARAQLARAQLGEAVFATVWAEGRAMPVEQAIDYALRP